MSEFDYELRETTMNTASPLLAAVGSKLNVYSAWFLGLFGVVTFDVLIGLCGVVIGVAGYMMNRRFKKKDTAIKKAREERDQISWEMAMIDRYGDTVMQERYGADWRHSVIRPSIHEEASDE